MNIEYFDDNKADRFKIEELTNIDTILASHNVIRDLYGIGQLTTLKELNLSYNNISDIRYYIVLLIVFSPLEDLVNLEKLWLNKNHILLIDPLKKLTKLKYSIPLIILQCPWLV